MKALTAAWCFIAISTALVSCKTDDHARIAYLCPSEKRERFVREGNFMVEHFSQKGIKSQMLHANDDEILQISQGKELIDQGVELLIITPVNGNSIAPLARYAKQNGVKVIAYNRLISNANLDFFVTGDNRALAEILCKAAFTEKPHGNYVVLAGDRFDRNGYELKQAIDSILLPKITTGEIKVVYETYIEFWNKQQAAYELQQVINTYGVSVDAVIACVDQMAEGAIEVLKQYNLHGKVTVTGQNAEKQSVRNIIAGLQCVTIYHPHQKLAEAITEVALKILANEDISTMGNGSSFNGFENVPTLKIKSIPITKSNYYKELVETGVYTAKDLHN
jgi:D-xylose transport system substrate-binding protein